MIRVHVRETGGIARTGQGLRFGVPLPPGAVAEGEALRLVDEGGGPLPLQTRPLAHWPTGGVKWLLCDTKVSLAAGQSLSVHLERGAPHSVEPALAVAADGAHVSVDTGVARFAVGGDGLLSAACGAGRVEAAGAVVLADAGGWPQPARWRAPVVEAAGPLAATVRVDGTLPGTPLLLVCRLDFLAGSGHVAVALCLHNPQAAAHRGGKWDLGDPGSVRFSGLSWRIAVTPGPGGVSWRETPTGAPRNADSFHLFQASSGGAAWDSVNHVGADGTVDLPFRGYRVTAVGTDAGGGERAQPTLTVHGDGIAVSVAAEQFWQHFPKALAADGEGTAIHLFPIQAGTAHELQGGERKTHRFHLCFGTPDDSPDATAAALPLVPEPDPEAMAESGAIPFLRPASAGPHGAYRTLVDAAVRGDRPFAARRETPDEYGWRHFGDLHADHEEAHYDGPLPLVSHYNNQYDVVYGALVQHLAGAGPGWWEIGTELARHVADIDIYHTRADRAAYNGGLFWHTDHYRHAATGTHRTYSRRSVPPERIRSYGGGPSNEHAYASGLALHHYLTGDPWAREAVLELAEWICSMDDGRRTVLGWVDGGPTGAASRTYEDGYHKPGRGAGNAVNTLLDAFGLTGDRAHLAFAEGLIRRVIHPDDDPDALELADAERRWSYTVFLQILARYLGVKEALGEVDERHEHARRALLAYARWMARTAVPYLSRPEALEYPTETWAAQEVRRANVFDLASRYAEPEEAERLRALAARFFAEATDGLAKFETATTVRPLAILLQSGWQRAAFAEDPPAPGARYAGKVDFAPPERFEPQALRVKRWLRSPVGWLRLAVGLLRNAPAKLMGGPR
jgi:hypothetical protein